MENKKEILVSIFPKGASKEKVIENNGKVLDKIFEYGETSESAIDGNYTFNGTFIIDNEGLYKRITQESILKVKLDYGFEFFYVKKVTRNTQSKRLTVVARQITIEATLGLDLDDVRPTKLSGQAALSKMYTRATGSKKEIIITSDIETEATAYYQDQKLYNAIHNCDQCFTNRWGGEVLRRGYHLSINKRIGMDRGATIRSGKNLDWYEDSIDMDNIYTRVKAKGYNGITYEGYVDSPQKDEYSLTRTYYVTYSDIKVKDESNPDEGFDTLAEAQAELKKRALEEFSVNHIDDIPLDFRLNTVQLRNFVGYENNTPQRIEIGDTVTAYINQFDLKVKVRALTKRYNVRTQKTIEIEFSNTPLASKSSVISERAILNELKKSSSNGNNSVQQYIQSMINAGITNSYFLPRQNECLWMDTKDINTATNVVRINKNGLAFSQTGYYGEYTYGFSIDGVFNASLIRTGLLTAIMIQSVDGKNFFDLTSGNIHLEKGIIGNETSYFDITQSLIHGNNLNLKLNDGILTGGNNLEIHFPNGTIKATKGRLENADGSYYDITGAWLHGKQLNIYANEGYISGGSSGQHYLDFINGKFNFKTGNETVSIDNGKVYNVASGQDYVSRVDTFTYSDMVNIELATSDICRKTININIPIANMSKTPKVSWNIQLFKGSKGYTFDSCWTENLSSSVSTSNLNVKFDIVYGGKDIDSETSLRNVGYSVTGVAIQS